MALDKFGFYPSIESIEPETINIVHTETGTPYFWYYLVLRNDRNWNFVFGSVKSNKTYKWKQGKKKLPNSHIKNIRLEVSEKLKEIALVRFGGAL